MIRESGGNYSPKDRRFQDHGQSMFPQVPVGQSGIQQVLADSEIRPNSSPASIGVMQEDVGGGGN